MLNRLFKILTASPVILASSAVIATCAGVLGANIVFDIKATDSVNAINPIDVQSQRGQPDGLLDSVSLSTQPDQTRHHEAMLQPDTDQPYSRDKPFLANTSQRSVSKTTANRNNAAKPGNKNNRYDARYRDHTISAEEPLAYRDELVQRHGISGDAANNLTSDSATTNVSSEASTEGDNNTDDSNNADNTSSEEIVYPDESNHEIQIDLDEKQTINCRKVDREGPPCLCTFTIDDGRGPRTEVIDNCS